jgi:hypothetical protein
MYDFLVIRLCQDQTTLLEAVTNLVGPLVYRDLEIKRDLGTDRIFINGQRYSVPANGKCTVEANNASISFGYFTEDAEVLDW